MMASENDTSGDARRCEGRTGVKVLKVPFFIINTLTWIGGGGLIGLAIWLVSSENEYKHFIKNEQVFIVYITLSTVLFTAGILGACGILLGNRVLLQMYFFIICLVFCTLFGLVIFGVVQRSRVDEIIRDSWNKTSDDTRIFLQEQFNCCGVSENNTGTKSNLHESCFHNITRKERKKDCLSKLFEWFNDNQIAIAASGGVVMFLLIFLMVASCCFINKVRTTSRNLKRTRVSPAQGECNNNVERPPYKNGGHVNEVMDVEPYAESYSNEPRREDAKTAKKHRSHQRTAWAKTSTV